MNKKYLDLMNDLIKIVDKLDKLNSADNSATEKDNNFINQLVIITKSYYFDSNDKIKLVIKDATTNSIYETNEI